MVVLKGGEPNMFNCRILYIGSAAALEKGNGVEAIQAPLNARYPWDLGSVEGIDAVLSVLPDRLNLRYMDTGEVVEFPLSKLKTCAALRSVEMVDDASGEQRRSFVPVNQIECDANHPAIFSAIIRRTTGRQIQECHSFICNSPRDALHLVNATATANMALKKGMQQNDRTIVIQNGYQSGYHSDNNRREILVNDAPPAPENDVIYIRSSTEVAPSPRVAESSPRIVEARTTKSELDTLRFKMKTPEPTSTAEDVIYVGFDKSNLVKKDDDDGFEMKPEGAHFQYHVAGPQSARPVLVQGPPRVISPPSPRLMYGPPPPRPIFIRGPPPPPPPQRMYERRAVTPQARVLVHHPGGRVRTRAKSSSPTRYAASTDVKMSKYHPRWRSHSSEIAGPTPRNYVRQNMFLNERAFAHRVNGDSRMAGSRFGYYGVEPGYNTLYDRPVTKSNPKYSSSESSSDDDRRDNRFRRSKR